MATKSDESRERFEIRGELDGRDAEALRLELVWLARRHGFEVEDFVVEPVKRPRGKPAFERPRRAMEKVVLRYGGKVSKSPK